VDCKTSTVLCPTTRLGYLLIPNVAVVELRRGKIPPEEWLLRHLEGQLATEERWKAFHRSKRNLNENRFQTFRDSFGKDTFIDELTGMFLCVEPEGFPLNNRPPGYLKADQHLKAFFES
jgi:hypothetical protein